jgi:hypothetical protein
MRRASVTRLSLLLIMQGYSASNIHIQVYTRYLHGHLMGLWAYGCGITMQTRTTVIYSSSHIYCVPWEVFEVVGALS